MSPAHLRGRAPSALLFALLLACAPAEEACEVAPGTPPPPLHPQVARALDLARAAESSPADPSPALRAHGATLGDLDAALYDVAVDPAWSAAYAGARAR